MTSSLPYIFSTLKGTKHKENWDELLIIEEDKFSIFAVFDGVSSAKAGKEGPDISKHYIQENYKKYLNGNFEVRKLMFDLNQHLVNLDLDEPYSTYCLVIFTKASNTFYYSWLGDSRIYYITNQYIRQLTEDDSFSENIISKYLGDATLRLSDFREFKEIKESGHLLLCTDGFYKIFETNKLVFFETFINNSSANLNNLNKQIDSLIKGKNLDDSTFIFLK
ncbi:MAG TPA: protein phosphatase 2C domain-containing protein [Puia sp.]|uniref:PP2C family protein-serine/threonine phosphatase n=1 Tax=Puia sp. TaxID=2045100 RepID=UPI002CB0EE08|nr:protein phosphatase 2C domain-containing protein [Puia sp.]HVU97976.1 protein phosphatase 2C domain-containing protein [Puia sp.]